MQGDPAGLLERITELVPLCEDPAIHRAVETGDAFKVYRALAWARLRRRLPEHRGTLDTLLRSRRLFARPAKRHLFLGTFNGFGATFLGKAEPEPDGTRIALHCVVAFFRLPLFPLGAYLVQPAGGPALYRRWQVFARVPLTSLQWLWSRATALGVIVAVGFAAKEALYASRHHDVTVVNALNRPLRVSLGPKNVVVPAGSHLTVNLPVGGYAFRATSETGTEIDSLQAEVKAGKQALVWNIAGAAPVYSETVVYASTTAAARPPPPHPTAYCGEHWPELPDVDFPFVPAPAQVSVASGGTESRVHVGIPPLSSDRQLTLCTDLLVEANREADAVALWEAEARLNNLKGAPARRAAYFAMLVDPAKGLSLSRRVRDADRNDVDAHRLYQTASELTGRDREVREEYRTLAAAQPDSVMAQYLAERLSDNPSAAAERLLQRFPNDANAVRLVVSTRFSKSDWAGTLEAWHRLTDLDTAQADACVLAPTTALVALGHPADALPLIERCFDRGNENVRFKTAWLYARVATLAGRQDGERLVQRLEEKEKQGPSVRVRLEAGLPDPGHDNSPGVVFLRAVPSDAAAALEAATQLRTSDFQNLTVFSWALVYGEAIRTGDGKAAASLGRALMLVGPARELFQRFVRGEPVHLDQGALEPEVRAAAAFIRSRNASLDAKERNELLAQARREDWLRTNISRAMAGWTPASAGH